MTSTTHFKQMTNINKTAVAKESGLKQLATAVAFALAPFAVVLGIAAMSVPSAEAGSFSYRCYQSGSVTVCDYN